MSSRSAPLLRKRAPADGKAKKLGVTRLADAPTRTPLGDVTNARAARDTECAADAPRLPPCMDVPPPASPPPLVQHVSLVADTVAFFELAAHSRDAPVSGVRGRAGAAGAWNLSGVLSSLQSRASALLTDDGALFDAAPARDASGGVLGTSLEAVSRVAAVVGTALDGFVEGGLDSLQRLGATDVAPLTAFTPPGAAGNGSRRASGSASAAPPSSSASAWDGDWGALSSPGHSGAPSWTVWQDTPCGAPQPGSSTVSALNGGAAGAPLRASRLGSAGRSASTAGTPPQSARGSAGGAAGVPNTPRESDDLAEQVRAQLQVLLAEKAKLAQENARLARENKSLQELLSYTMSCGDDEEHADGDASAEQPGEQVPC